MIGNSKKDGKDQESIQSSTTPDPGTTCIKNMNEAQHKMGILSSRHVLITIICKRNVDDFNLFNPSIL